MFLLAAILAFFIWINFRYGKTPISLCGIVAQVSEYFFTSSMLVMGKERNYCLNTMLEERNRFNFTRIYFRWQFSKKETLQN